MKDLVRFVHMSDPHFDVDYSGRRITRLHDITGITLTEQFKTGMRHIRENSGSLDFLLLSGDLVHEGETEDYRAFRELLREQAGDIPVYVALGNHDEDTFWQGWRGESRSGSFNYEIRDDKSGLRIIVLDSRGGPYGSGSLSGVQLEWLRERLETDTTPAVLMMHHTPHESGEVEYLAYQMEHQAAAALGDIVDGSSLLGIFTGHTHRPFVSKLRSVDCYTAMSITFSIETTMEAMAWDNITGYHLCEIRDGKLSVEQIRIIPETIHSEVIPYKELFPDFQESD